MRRNLKGKKPGEGEAGWGSQIAAPIGLRGGVPKKGSSKRFVKDEAEVKTIGPTHRGFFVKREAEKKKIQGNRVPRTTSGKGTGSRRRTEGGEGHVCAMKGNSAMGREKSAMENYEKIWWPEDARNGGVGALKKGGNLLAKQFLIVRN